MLTADLVRVARHGDLLTVRPLQGATRTRAVALAAAIVGLVREHVGAPRALLDEALAALEVGPRDRRLAEGLVKLALDRCDFAMTDDVDPVALRRQVFRAAALARRATPHGHTFLRDTVLAQVAEGLGLTPEAVDDALFADLGPAHRLLRFRALPALALVEAYDRGQVQAVLLRALRVVVTVHAGHPSAYRRLFQRVKFLRLLFRLERLDDGGYRLELDGPYSLFDAVTKYGVHLAQLVPALDACEAWELEADVAWGRERERCRFVASGGTDPGLEGEAVAPLADDVAALVERLRAEDTPWDVQPFPEILDLPGVGLCVPDLAFRHRDTGAVAYLEVLGFWSREAVFRRVDLVQAGLPYRVLFAVSERLRVSADVLPPAAPGALYVYKGVMSARRVRDWLDATAP